MFVVCTGDGLGNQMFHYAFYCALELKYLGNEIKMSIEDFYGSVNVHNGYELERIFGINVNKCSFKQALSLADYFPTCKHKFINMIFKLRKALFGPKDSYITVDDPTVFYKEVFELSQIKDYMFRGTWINEKYFKECKQRLLREFVFPEITEESNMKYVERIENCNSVSIHVRRGDYIALGMAHLTIDYYKQAIELLKKKCEKELQFFVFTDDSEYVRKEFSFLENCTYIEGNTGDKNFRDMQLMAKCKHNIISNSTFAFWGAYLNQNEEKIVIAPKKSVDIYKNSFACEEWILL